MDIGMIDGMNTTKPPAVSTASNVPGGALGKDQFLQLLMTQMQNQDPLDPMDGKESIAQLAQFSSLEQMQNLNDQFAGYRQEVGLMESLLLKGATVKLQMAEGEVEGVVDKITWGSGGMQLYIGENVYPVSAITGMSIIAPASAVAEPVVTEPAV